MAPSAKAVGAVVFLAILHIAILVVLLAVFLFEDFPVRTLNSLIDRFTVDDPLNAINDGMLTTFRYIPFDRLTTTPLEYIQEVQLKFKDDQESERSLIRFDVVSGVSTMNNTTSLLLGLNQTLVLTADSSALYDENMKLIAISSFDDTDEASSGHNETIDTTSRFGILERTSNSDKKGDMAKIREKDSETNQETGGQSGLTDRRLFMKKTTTHMQQPAFYGAYPVPYPYPYPVQGLSRPLYTRPYLSHAAHPIMHPIVPSSVGTVLIQPQQSPTYVVPQATIPAAVSPLLQPDPGLRQRDLDILSNIIKASNEKLREELLDLNFDPSRNRDRRHEDALNDLADKLEDRLRFNERRPVGQQRGEQIMDLNYAPGSRRTAYADGFNDGYRDGYGDGVDTGEKVTKSLWCSIDKKHPLCVTKN